MRPRSILLLIVVFLTAWGALLAQKPWREYQARGAYTEVPPDYDVPHEWVTARLMYRGGGGGFFGRRGRGRSSWATDYPAADRHLIEGLRRLSRIDVRSVEQPVEMDGSDDPYNWPFLYAVEVGRWDFSEDEAKQLREFIDRGGFLMVDDFHGSYEWEDFMYGLTKVFPDKEVEDIPPDDHIMHMLSDVDQSIQVAGIVALRGGVTYERDGITPHWRAIYDDKDRIVVAICHNMDLGDAWEWSDDPNYPADMAGVAHRILVNYAAYDLTH